jgi:hypothetical protein
MGAESWWFRFHGFGVLVVWWPAFNLMVGGTLLSLAWLATHMAVVFLLKKVDFTA